ncbi:hypothetical protein IWX49DRAFT_623212 [Phyllosticta citricarpa]|uniref:Uncharacterized protein n=1 Tax=Phyllosticta citricarpa TaxID=55181 RepID=A0ABR1MQS5_9PEZI
MSPNDTSEQPPTRPRYPSVEERKHLFASYLQMPRNHNAWIVVHTDGLHICNDRSAFITYEAIKPFDVRTASSGDPGEEDLGLNNKYVAFGIGQVWLSYKTLDGAYQKRHLHDVLHIPEAFANIVILPRLLYETTSSYKLDKKRGIAFSVDNSYDLAWFPPDCQGLHCLALDGETPYFPGPSSLYRRGPIRSLFVQSVGMPLPNGIDTLQKLFLVIKLVLGSYPRHDERAYHLYTSQKTELPVAKLVDLIKHYQEKAKKEYEMAALSCPKQQCFFGDAFVLRSKGKFVVCKDRHRLSNFKSIPPRPATEDHARVYGIGDLCLPVYRSNGSTGTLDLKGVIFCPKNLVNSIPYTVLFDRGMLCEDGSFDLKTGVAMNKDGDEVAWFKACHDPETLCLLQPYIPVQRTKPEVLCEAPGLTPPAELTDDQSTNHWKRMAADASQSIDQSIAPEKREPDASAPDEAPDASKRKNQKVSFFTPDGSVGQIGPCRRLDVADHKRGQYGMDPLPPPAAREKTCQAAVLQDDKSDIPQGQKEFACPAVEAPGKETVNPGTAIRKVDANTQTVNPQPSPSQPAVNSPTITGDPDLIEADFRILDTLITEFVKRNPELDFSHLLASPCFPSLPSGSDLVVSTINQSIFDFCCLSYCFARCVTGGKLTEKQRIAYFDALAKMMLLWEDAPGVLARTMMIEDDDDAPSETPPLSDLSSLSTPSEPQTPPPVGMEMQFHDSPLALVERVLLHCPKAMKAIAEAATNGDKRARDLMVLFGLVVSPQMRCRMGDHYERALRTKYGWGADKKTGMQELTVGEEEAATIVGETATKGDDVLEKSTQDDTLDVKSTPDEVTPDTSAQEKQFIEETMLQAAKESFIAGLLKLNQQNLALREQHAAQKRENKPMSKPVGDNQRELLTQQMEGCNIGAEKIEKEPEMKEKIFQSDNQKEKKARAFQIAHELLDLAGDCQERALALLKFYAGDGKEAEASEKGETEEMNDD